ncbi:MAG: UDP-2,3-diacylglucosamine diphosphatase LpxI [Bryobacterales bacterium]|nr:UDP-2,3-diacylglucosamine diphosphatase LpxI [Bryobacterales bacterium]
MRYGLLAGNGRFPILALTEARKLGHEVVVIGIDGEADFAALAPLTPALHRITIAQLSKLIDICRSEQVTELMFAGQVKHVSIFSSLRPDWRLLKLLTSLPEKNTDALIGGVIKVLADEGITVADSTRLLKPLLAPEGVMTRRKPTSDEEKQLKYGRRIAAALSGFDIGQSVAISERACVALEAMEGTDAMLRRAASMVNGKPLVLVKGSRRRGHLLFDVPVAGPQTIATMVETGTTALAVDAGRTLLLDREDAITAADKAGLAIVGYKVEDEA